METKKRRSEMFCEIPTLEHGIEGEWETAYYEVESDDWYFDRRPDGDIIAEHHAHTRYKLVPAPRIGRLP